MDRKLNLAIGVLIYNPSDDPGHICRISSCLISLIESAKYSDQNIKILFLLNYSSDYKERRGVGIRTEKVILDIYSKYILSYFDLFIAGIEYKNSMNVAGYNFIQEWCYLQDTDYIVVSADDYVYPLKWLVRLNNFYNKESNKEKFIIPTTTFLAQGNLQAPIRINGKWDINYSETGEILGINSKLEVSDVNKISNYCQLFPDRPYHPPPMFEVSVIPRVIINKIGFVDKNYYSIFYNIEYFDNIISQNFKGIISNKLFVFHYGKGATRATFNFGDEKYLNSPVENRLLSDIKLYNNKNIKNIKPWWGKNPSRTKYRGFIYCLLRQIYHCSKEIFAQRQARAQ